MSEFMQDSGHHWMRDCDTCGGWHPCSAPEDADAETDWECATCRTTQAAIAKKDETIKAQADALLEVRQFLRGTHQADKERVGWLLDSINTALRLCGRFS